MRPGKDVVEAFRLRVNRLIGIGCSRGEDELDLAKEMDRGPGFTPSWRVFVMCLNGKA